MAVMSLQNMRKAEFLFSSNIAVNNRGGALEKPLIGDLEFLIRIQVTSDGS